MCIRDSTITTQEIQGKLTDLMEELAGGRSFHRLVSELMAVSFLVYVNRLLYDSLHQKSAVYENVLYLNICAGILPVVRHRRIPPKVSSRNKRRAQNKRYNPDRRETK